MNSTKYLQQQIETEFLLWQLSWIMCEHRPQTGLCSALHVTSSFFFPPVSLLPAGLHCGMSPLKSRFSLTAFYFNITVSFKLKWEQSYKMRDSYTIAAEKTNSIS